jgi:hypothetical protein
LAGSPYCNSIDFKTDEIQEVAPLIDEAKPNPEPEKLFEDAAELGAAVDAEMRLTREAPNRLLKNAKIGR